MQLFSESKDEVSLIVFGTSDTANDLASGDSGYENICVARPLAPVDWSILKYVQNEVQPGTVSADGILSSLMNITIRCGCLGSNKSLTLLNKLFE